MSNVNNWAFSKHLDTFKLKIIDPQIKKVSEAKTALDNTNTQWGEGQKALTEGRLKNYSDWLAFYKEFHEQGMTLVKQHENLVNLLSKWYDKWYQDISNEGKQETELMSIQADMLNEIFVEIYKELLPLKLEGMNPPQGLNLK